MSACSARDDHIRKCLLTLLERPDVPYRSHAAALENLALQRQAEDIPFLISVAKNPNKMGQHGLIRSGAIRALGQTRSMDAYNLLSDLIEHPELSHERCRPWLFTSLAACAIWLGPLCIKRATETIVHGLSEDSAPVRWRCVLALTLLEAKNSISSILESEPLWDARDFHAVRRQIRNMRESVDGGIGLTQQKVKEMMKSIEDLESRLYKMEMLNKKMEAEKSVTQDKKEEEKK